MLNKKIGYQKNHTTIFGDVKFKKKFTSIKEIRKENHLNFKGFLGVDPTEKKYQAMIVY